MKIKGIGFDIGGTLVNYNKPLNWSASYEDAIRFMCQKNNIDFNLDKFEKAKKILEKYNTRMNPRKKEVTSEIIFGEIFDKWNENRIKLKESKKSFYEFFQREVVIYDDSKKFLKYCKKQGIKCAVYTDVAYGMDDEFSLQDINQISDFIDLKLTSENVGYRKPHRKGFDIMLSKFMCKPEEMLFVGDELKDIKGAKAVGMQSILINRDGKTKEFDQDYTVKDLCEIIDIIESI